MPSKAATRVTTFRFDQMATPINDRVDNPAESGVERYVGLEHLDADSLRIQRWGEITDVESTKLRFQPGDIIFGKRRVYQRKLAVADFEGICSAHAMVLRAKPNVALPEFLPFFMQSDRFMERALAISVGSLSPTINWATLAAEEFALPPIEEQPRLVALCLAASAAFERTADCLQTCEHAVSAIRMSCFDPQRFSPVPLSRLCDDGRGIQIGPFGAQLHQSDYETGGVPVVMPLNMKDDRIVEDGIARVSEAKAQSLALHRVRDGDILLPRRGDLDRRALVTARSEGWLCGTGSIRVRIASPTSPVAVLNALASPHCLRWLRANAVGTTMPNLNTTIVGNIPIALPPKEMLGGALAALAMLETERERLCSRLEALGRVRQAIVGEAVGRQ